MATVSILIPAFKPEFLGRALLSAQQQTFRDVEILVGDDTADGRLAEIVARADDPRVRYFHHGFQDGLLNSRRLWERAEGKYVKWLYDDDLLMPESVQVLVEALESQPESALAFHQRVLIDENDVVTGAPSLPIKVGERSLVTRDFLVHNLVAKLHNFIGEPSNILLRRDRVDGGGVFAYRSVKLQFLNDVAMYLNLAERAPLVAVGGRYSALRQHAGQNSGVSSPIFSAGRYEWEVLVRGEAAAGRLGLGELAEARGILTHLYSQYAAELPELARLLANLPELVTRAPAELFDSPRFREDLAFAHAAVAERAERRRSQPVAAPQAAPAQRICVVCEQPVDKWHPYPHALDVEFAKLIHSVGSKLDRYLCPSCYCNDRDRHLWLYIAYSGALENASSMRILHIAPEQRIEQRIRRLNPLEYIGGDLSPRDLSHRKINVEAMEFPSGYFDLIISNHVLEHVDSPQAALAEFNRCLKPGGRLIAQTPYSPLLKYTFELTEAPSVPFASHYFGQSDHVRLFGADIGDVIRAAGFSGDLLPHEHVLPDIDPETVGCNEEEPFFFFTKSGEPPAAAQPRQVAAPHADARPAPPLDGIAVPADLAALPIRIVCATRVAKENFLRDTALGRSLAAHRYARPPELLLFDNNSTGLPALYNAAIEQAASNPAILLFVHDDVSIMDYFWTDRVREGLARFDIVGLAGNKRRSPRQPSWAFATPDFQWDRPEFLSGSVGHGKSFPCEVASFGPAGVECKLLDGLMLVANSARLVASGVRFDEQFEFHFYDLDFCRQAENHGLRMGTWPISVVHESGGSFNTPAWRAAYERYVHKYGE